MSSNEAKNALERARKDVIEAEKDISDIKKALATINTTAVKKSNANNDADSSSGDGTTLRVAALEIKGRAVSVPSFQVRLSAPPSIQSLSQLWDPLNTDAPGGIATFRGVDTELAMVTLIGLDGDNELGRSASFDVKPLAELELKECMEEVFHRHIDIALIAKPITNLKVKKSVAEVAGSATEASSKTSEPVTVEKAESFETATGEEAVFVDISKNDSPVKVFDEPTAKAPSVDAVVVDPPINSKTNLADTFPAKGDEHVLEVPQEKSDSNGTTKTTIESTVTPTTIEPPISSTPPVEMEESKSSSTLQLPVCTVSLRISIQLSNTERQDSIYELLNRCTKAKTAAVEHMRKCASVMGSASKSKSSSTSATSKVAGKKAAVKSGFLNKKKTVKVNWFADLYQRKFGPNSMLRHLAPIVKNYLLFCGVVGLMHYKGQELSLPAPI